MARTPHADQPFLTFSRDHINVWSGGAGQPPVIGLSSQQLLDSEAACAAAEAAYQAMTAARNASKAATEAKDNAFAALRAIIGADIDTIDAFGKATGDPSVWVKAQIPAPKDPSEREAPPAPAIGENQFILNDSQIGDSKHLLLDWAFFDTADIDKLEIEIDNNTRFRRTADLNNYVQANGKRVPDANAFVVDTSENGYGTEVLPLTGLRDFRYIAEMSGSGAFDIYEGYIGRLK